MSNGGFRSAPVPDDVFVLDAINHAYNFSRDNRMADYANFISEAVYGMHCFWTPQGRPELIIDKDTYETRLCDAYVTAHTMFGESHTDACIYHELPLYGYFRDGGSPLWVAEEMRERWPGRVYIYGGISPHQPGALGRVDELVENHGVSGIKLYPHDVVAGELKSFRMDDEDLLFPIFERCQKLGLKTVAVHKASVMGPVPIEPYYVNDVGAAARAFPDLIFEVVHGGMAFMDETLFLLTYHPNVTVSTEATTAYLWKAPRRFAEIIGNLILAGAGDRILWAIGGAVVHSRVLEELFWGFEMPEDLIEYGLPPLTEEIKRNIFGLNAARVLGLDVEQVKKQINTDEYAKPRDLDEPWSSLKEEAVAIA